MILLLQGCKRACPPARDLLLPDEDFALQAELCAMLEKPERMAEKPTWQLDHKKEYDKVYARWGAGSPCLATRTSPWLSILNAYQRSVLALNQHKVLAKTVRLYTATGHDSTVSDQQTTDFVQERRTIPVLMIDVRTYGSIQRTPRTSTHDEYCQQEIAPCIAPDQRLWFHIETPRPLLGREAMLFQGWPISLVELDKPWITDSFLYGLAGNAVACPVMLAILMATISAISITDTDVAQEVAWSNEDEEEQEAALLLLHGLGPALIGP